MLLIPGITRKRASLILKQSSCLNKGTRGPYSSGDSDVRNRIQPEGEHMAPEADTKMETVSTTTQTPAQPPKPVNPAVVKKAIALGKEICKQPAKTKADAARAMFELIPVKPREIVVQAFIDGAGLTAKGAQTYFYNCKRKAKKAARYPTSRSVAF